ncbi:hypothetical protein N7504_002147 [Penicillium tannophilum]|nr:hypothetical protein N7504_002147 [Penicillium tannophilum]
MPSTTFNFSAALCLFLAVGPATVLSAPQLGGLPLLGGAGETPATGNTEKDAGAGYDVGIPGGPNVAFGAGVHSETHGPCGPGVSSEKDAGAGYDVGIPGGPNAIYGAGAHEQHDAYPCPEPVAVPVPETTTEPVVVPITEPTTEPVVVPVPGPTTEPVVVPVPEPTTTSTSTYVPMYIPPTYTTPIDIPTITTVPAYVPPPMAPVRSTPLIQRPAPSATPSSMPVYNAGSSMTPSSLLALALPIMAGIFY